MPPLLHSPLVLVHKSTTPPGHPTATPPTEKKGVLGTSLPLATSSQQQKRVAGQQDGEHANGAKRSRALAIPNGAVKEERLWQGGEEADRGAEGEGALLPVVQAMEEPQINVRCAVSHLHCHACLLPLKPPTFKCEADHFVCRACRGSHVQACAGAGNYVHCVGLDRIVGDVKVPCANEAYGCASWVLYYEAPDHHRSCQFAPCLCPDPGCGRFTSPARLAEHFSSDHAWPISKVDYAKPYKFAVPGLQDKLVLVSEADGSVFLVSPCDLGAVTGLSLVCVRACGDAAAGVPQYTCKLWTEVAGTALLLTSMLASSDLRGGFPAIDQLPLLPLLYGESGEPPSLMVRIDKVGASAGRSRSPSATPPSSLRSPSATPPSSCPGGFCSNEDRNLGTN